MIIKTLKIKNFRRIKERSIDFQSGINVLKGPNEIGKSSIISSFETLLFVDVFSNSRSLVKRNINWISGSLFELEMLYSTTEGDFIVKKDYKKKEVFLKDLNSNRVIEENEKATRLLLNHLGILSRAVFDSTALITQKQIARLNLDNDLRSAIQRSLLRSNGKDITDILQSYEREYKEMGIGLRGVAKNPGIIKRLEEEISVQKAKVEDIKRRLQRVQNATVTKVDSSKKLKEVSQKVEDLEKRFENQKIYDEGKKEIAEIERQTLELTQEISEIETLQSNLAQFDKELENFAMFKAKDKAYLDKVAEDISELSGEIKGISQILEKLQKEIELLLEESVETSNTKLIIGVSVGVLIVSLIIGFFVRSIYMLPIGIVLSLVSSFVIKKLTKESNQKVIKAEKLRKDFDEQQKLIAEKQSELINKLKEFSFESPDQFYTLKAQYIALDEKYRELKAMLDAKLKGRNLVLLKKQRADLLNKKAEIEATKLTDEIVNARINPEEYLKKRRELDMLKLDKRKLEQEQTASQVRVKDAEVTNDDLVVAEERLDQLLAEQKRAKKQFLMLELNIEAINRTISSTIRSSTRMLQDSIEKYLPYLTGGRYSKVRIDERLNIQILSQEKDDYVLPEDLSGGTIDQIYFLARLAILDLIDSEKRSPLFLDDPFVTFDSERLGYLHDILKKISKERQVLLFTCHDDYVDWGNVIEIRDKEE